MTIRVLVADDHPMLREGLASVLGRETDVELVGEAQDGREAIDAFQRLRPDVVLMDLQMPGVDGLAAIKAIRAEDPSARIVVLTTYSGDAQALRALRAGAAGYLLKSSLRRELVDTIRAVHAGRRYLHPDVAQEIAVNAISEPLTDREVEILQLLANGQANKEISRSLNLAEATVKAHLRSIFEKLDVQDRTQAVTFAARRGIITL